MAPSATKQSKVFYIRHTLYIYIIYGDKKGDKHSQ